jgi:putative redox protein
MGREARITYRGGKFQHDIAIGPHRLIADEPVESGGDDAGLAPHEFLLAALGACTAMTLRLYAERKQWPLRSVEVRITQEKRDGVHVMSRSLAIEGDLDDEQRQRLLEIAQKCPVHKTLTGEIRIDTELQR